MIHNPDLHPVLAWQAANRQALRDGKRMPVQDQPKPQTGARLVRRVATKQCRK